MSDYEFRPHIAAAIANLTAQFDGTNIEEIAAVLVRELDEIEEVLRQLYEEVWLPVAVGKQLDGIGQIVDLGRNIGEVIPRYFYGYEDQENAGGYTEATYADDGAPQYSDSIMGDEEYRIALQAKIFVNTGNCSIYNVVQVVSEIAGAPAVVIERGNAHFSLEVPMLLPTNIAALLSIDKVLPKAGGVKIEISYYDRIAFGYHDQSNSGAYGVAAYSTELQQTDDVPEFMFDRVTGRYYRVDGTPAGG